MYFLPNQDLRTQSRNIQKSKQFRHDQGDCTPAHLAVWRVRRLKSEDFLILTMNEDAYRRLCPGTNLRVDDRTVKSAPASETSE